MHTQCLLRIKWGNCRFYSYNVGNVSRWNVGWGNDVVPLKWLHFMGCWTDDLQKKSLKNMCIFKTKSSQTYSLQNLHQIKTINWSMISAGGLFCSAAVIWSKPALYKGPLTSTWFAELSSLQTPQNALTYMTGKFLSSNTHPNNNSFLVSKLVLLRIWWPNR